MKKLLIPMTGNEACAEAAIRAGCRCYFAYPITPQSEIPEYFASNAQFRKNGGVFLQAGSEIAAINMVYGASAAGVRVMTSSSSPGISLKQEGISYIAGAELPAVIVNVVRGGPGLGNIAPSQEDYFQATRGGGHGNYRTPVLAPSTVQEFADLTMDAFELADKYRNPVMILADGLMGQMTEPVEFKEPKRKIFKKDWALTGAKGRMPNLVIPFYLYENELEEKNRRLQDKYQKIKENEVRFETFTPSKKKLPFDILLVGYGTVARILKSVSLEANKLGINAPLVRPITLWPFPYSQVRSLAKHTGHVLVVEMSDGQMIEDVKLSIGEPADVEIKVHLYNRMGGVVPTPEEILEEVKRILDGRPKKERLGIKIETDKEVFGKFLGSPKIEKADSNLEPIYTRPKSLSQAPTTYCPGCNHSTTHKIIAEVIDELGIREETVAFWPVGCAVLGYRFFNLDGIVNAHGRAQAAATGYKRSRPDKIVLSYQGDGDLAAIGILETIFAANRGENFTVIFINNALYGMTGGQMAPTTLIGQKTTTCPYGRDAKNEGYPIRMCELLATLPAPYYIARVAMYNPKEIRKAKKAIKKAFQYQVENRGYTFVEVLSACPTGWKMKPLDALKWIEEKMVPVFPLGIFRDKGAEKCEKT